MIKNISNARWKHWLILTAPFNNMGTMKSLPSITAAELWGNKKVWFSGVKRSCLHVVVGGFQSTWSVSLLFVVCQLSSVVIIMIDNSKKQKSLDGVEVQNLYFIERCSNQGLPLIGFQTTSPWVKPWSPDFFVSKTLSSAFFSPEPRNLKPM